jgi:hypothetical protein
MAELFLIENQEVNTKLFSRSDEVLLHEDTVEILFKYKEKLCHKFDDIRGTFLIDHLAIHIIDPNNRIIMFSTTPSVEYNLIANDLWKHDRGFSVNYQIENRFYSWEKAYEKEYFEELKSIKQMNHQFSFGFNLSKKIESFQFIYSFATRHKNCEFLEYYCRYINELFAIGDYGYKAISNICEQYIGIIPTTTAINFDKNIRSFSPFLKLISSNQ